MLAINVKKSFHKQHGRLFHLDLSFSVNSGFTVLTGPSGAGKTSLLRMIAGILTPDEGVIELGSTVYFDRERRINIPIQQRNVGFVFQDYALFPHMTATQNIAFGVRTAASSERRAKAEEMLSLFHIEHIADRLPHEMSGGEQQRVALARALSCEPRIALLDEPLSAVDIETRGKLLDEIESAQDRAKIPFIYVTHNEAEAARLGTNRIYIRDGLVAAAEIA